MIYLVTAHAEIFKNDEYTIITPEESLEMMSSWKRLQFDTETDGRDSHVNRLLCMQFGNKDADTQIVVDCSCVDVLLYKELLENKPLIGHNLKFDLQFLYNYKIIPRKIYDTMIVEQLLYLGYPSGQISYSLKEVAKRYLDIDIDKTVRGEIIWRGLDSSVVKYAAGDVQCLEDIMMCQKEDCIKKDCVRAAKLECDFVPVIAYLEWCGIKLDEDKWKKKMVQDKANLDIRKKDLDNFLIRASQEGVLNHKGNVLIESSRFQKYVMVDLQGDLFAENPFDTTPKCVVNWDSASQVVEIAKLLGFDPRIQDKKTGEDKDTVLEKHLKGQRGICDEFLKLYFDYKESSKLCSTYGQGHLDAVNPNTGRIHTVYRQIGCASGRMSCGSNLPDTDLAKLKKISPKRCKQPNLQQLPGDERTRSCFVAEEGNKMVSCDYSAIESRLGGDIYQEHAIINEFLYGSGDMHSLVAKMVFPELKDVPVKDIKKKYPELRKRAKPIEFSQQFGGTAMAIASSMGCSIEEAEKFADAYAKGFSGISEFKKRGSRFVKEHGYVLICPKTGHKMWWWDWRHWKETAASFTPEFWEEYRTRHKNTGDVVAQEVREHFQAGSKWERMALNAPTQGTGCCCLKTAAKRLFDWVVDNGYFDKVKFCAFVHDEIVAEYPEKLEEFPVILEKIMEDSAAEFCKSLPVPADASVGTCWIH